MKTTPATIKILRRKQCIPGLLYRNCICVAQLCVAACFMMRYLAQIDKMMMTIKNTNDFNLMMLTQFCWMLAPKMPHICRTAMLSIHRSRNDDEFLTLATHKDIDHDHDRNEHASPSQKCSHKQMEGKCANLKLLSHAPIPAPDSINQLKKWAEKIANKGLCMVCLSLRLSVSLYNVSASLHYDLFRHFLQHFRAGFRALALDQFQQKRYSFIVISISSFQLAIHFISLRSAPLS